MACVAEHIDLRLRAAAGLLACLCGWQEPAVARTAEAARPGASVLRADARIQQTEQAEASIELREPLRSPSSLLRLGEIANLRTRDLGLLRTLMQLPVGRMPSGAGGLAIDRESVARALRMHRPATDPTLRLAWSGPTRTWVHRAEQQVDGLHFASAARRALSTGPAAGSVSAWRIERAPRAMTLPQGALQLDAGVPLVASGGQRMRVPVHVRVDGRAHGVAWVGFESTKPGGLASRPSQAQPDSVLALADTSHPFTTTEAAGDTQQTMAVPPMLRPQGRLPVTTQAPAQSLPSVRPLLVRRGDAASFVLQHGGVSITTSGRALQDGATGDAVRVQLAGGRGEFVARVNDAGRLELAP